MLDASSMLIHDVATMMGLDAGSNQDGPLVSSEPGSGAMAAPSASSMLARVVYAVVQGHEEVKILYLRPHEAAVEIGKKVTLILFTWEEARGDDLFRQLMGVMRKHAKGPLVVGLIGGTDRARRVLEQAKPVLTQVKVSRFHIDISDELWTKDAGPVRHALPNFERTSPPSEEEWARLLEESAAAIADFEEETKEALEFAAALNSRRPVVTFTLTGIILAVFGLEFAFGGTQSPPVLLRMGALSPERILAGEVWRLFSCTFLHSGPMHVVLNIYVLLVLGSALERVLGTWRFLVLYGLSCLGASLVSLVFLEGFSVGASGGLWGLLGAEAVLAWRSQGLLPSTMVKGARRAATINLGINLLNSFRPHVDIWAHFGGGAVGAALLLSGTLTRGLPRLDELKTKEHLDGAGEVPIRSGTSLKLAGSALAAALLFGLGLGLSMGKPWALQRPLEYVRTPLPDLGISLALPKGLNLTPSPPGEPPSVNVGDLVSDLGAVIVAVYPGELTDEAVLAKEHAALVEALQKVPPGARLAAGPNDVSIAGARGITVRYRYENGIEEELAFVFLADALVKVDALRWPSFGDAVPRGYAAEVLDSLQPLPPSANPAP